MNFQFFFIKLINSSKLYCKAKLNNSTGVYLLSSKVNLFINS